MRKEEKEKGGNATNSHITFFIEMALS